MRDARTQDHWRRLYKQEYGTALHGLEYSNIRGLGKGSVHFHGALTAICGPNGSGKSTLLQAIYGVLTDGKSGFKFKISEGSVGGSMTADGKEGIKPTHDFLTGNTENLPENLNVYWLELTAEAPELIRKFRDMKNTNELLEAVGPKILPRQDIERFEYVVGKEYETIEIYELEGLFERDIVPYFLVTARGITYGNEQMGLGEFSIFLMLWTLGRLEKQSILLIEEPESFISPRSQVTLMNVVAATCAEKQIWCVITTHSQNTLLHVPNEHIRILVKSDAQGVLYEPKNEIEYLKTLGFKACRDTFLLVEDAAAAAFMRSVLRVVSPTLIDYFEIAQTGGTGPMLDFLARWPAGIKSTTPIGVLDGDMKGSGDIPKSIAFEYLPSKTAPDAILKNTAYANTQLLAERARLELPVVQGACAACEGVDKHDWLHRFSEIVGLPYDHGAAILFGIWLDLPENREEATRLVESIKARAKLK